MNTADQLNQKLQHAFEPAYLSVENESHMHNVPPGSESHFKVVVVSDVFESKTLVARHRAINKLLADELAGSIHALALHTFTPQEWEARQQHAMQSPDCHGGSGR